jgi:hypothetical protein
MAVRYPESQFFKERGTRQPQAIDATYGIDGESDGEFGRESEDDENSDEDIAAGKDSGEDFATGEDGAPEDYVIRRRRILDFEIDDSLEGVSKTGLKWTPEEKRQLQQMKALGRTYEEISAALTRTVASVSQQWRKAAER